MAAAGVNSFSSSTAFLLKITHTMAKHPEIVCIIAALVFSLSTKYSQSHQRVLLAPQPHPRRFFASTSPVLDFPYGNLGAVAELLAQEEVIFVMYYAPWCAKSMRTRTEFERAATYLQDKVLFVGVNCWYSHGQCREENSFTSYPVLIVYHTTLNGHHYKGVLEADYMVVFLQRILLPLTNLQSKDDVGNFIAEKDHVVIGFFDFHMSPQPPGFDQFYYASMRVLEREPRNPVEFGVITSPHLGAQFNFQGERHLLLTQPFNETLRYSESANFTSSAIAEWVLSRVAETKKSVKWMLPSGTKSLSLSLEVQKSPTLIIFTPHSPLYPTNHEQALVRELALSYHNCENSTKIRNTVQTSIYIRWKSTLHHVDLIDKCQELREKQAEQEAEEAAARSNPLTHILTCCSSVVPFGAPTATNSCNVCMHYSPIHPLSRQHCPLLVVPELPWHSLHSLSSCLELRASYNPSEYISMCCDHSHRHPPTTPPPPPLPHQPQSTDPYINHAADLQLAEQCRGLRLQRTFGWLPVISVPGLANLGMGSDFTGLGCQTNKSINFLTMNTKLSGAFADKLGLNMAPGDTSAVYLDEEMVPLDRRKREAQYVFEEEFTKANLLSFIKNVSEGSQPRSLRSSPLSPGNCDEEHTEMCVIELNTETYEEVVMDPEKDVVVYYYAPWCGFCASFSHVYLTLARYFRTSPDIVFTRIDASENDLPWEFTVDIYPTLHFFPAHRKEDSLSFPCHLHPTLPNLIQFVLRFAMPDLRLTTGLSICSRTCIQNNQLMLASRIQELHASALLLHRRALLLSQKLKSLKEELEQQERAETHQVSLHILQDYVYSLRRKVRRRQLEYRNARHLHQTLLTSHGVFIDKHKLSGILRNHQHLMVALRDLDHSNLHVDIETDDVTAESDDVTGGSHDVGVNSGEDVRTRDEL